MCGIAGIWNFNSKTITNEVISRFTDAIAHRGPDGRGIWHDAAAGVALGHRRLAILDLSVGGHQPMGYADDRYWVTYNGEIYNFIELRSELQSKGHQFRTQSDTEVILAAYVEWGQDMLLRFNGMWAFAIWDKTNRTFFLARDRFGVKPFYYRLTSNQLAFASELKAFQHLDGFSPILDEETAQVLLQNSFRVEGSRRSLMKGVNRLQGGHFAVVKANGAISVQRWWNTLNYLVVVGTSTK